MLLTNGDRFARFVIAEFVGSSSTGARYRALDTRSQTSVLLDILGAAGTLDPARHRAFDRTNEVLQHLDNDTISRILDFGTAEGLPWVTTELRTGPDAESLQRSRFPTGMSHQGVCVIIDRVARALDDAASHGVTHGNVTPTDIIISEPFSKNYRISIRGFGQCVAAGAPAAPGYAAPEVLTGAAATNSSDQFALAATAFRLLTGRPAFPDSGRAVTTDGELAFDQRPLDDESIAVNSLDRVFARAFAFDPARRFRSCGEFADALHSPARLSEFPVPESPRPTTHPAPVAAHAGRSKLPLAAAAVLVVAALVAAAVFVWPSDRPTDPEAAVTAAPAPAPVPTPGRPESSCSRIDATLAGLSLRQKLAQTLMVGVTGIDDARAVVDDHQVGGIFIGSWTDLSMLTSGELRALQAAPRPLPLAVSIDEEGGRVQRLRSLIGSQESPRQLVAQGTTPQQVREIAFERGSAMRDFGITIDFAPVVDITDAPDNTVIGDRSFGNDAATVIEYAGAYAQGLRDAGLLPVLKHFPGHGRASGDSHVNGVTTPPIDDLMQSDTVPYRTLTTQKPVAVMLGHMEVPGLTGSDPASLSGPAYDLLRQGGYGGPAFDGPIFTDDLSSMGAINQRYGVSDAVLLALQAGADTALWISTDEVPAVLDRLEAAVGNGELAAARVDDAVRQMAVTKDPTLRCVR